jgi:hypothetical protein
MLANDKREPRNGRNLDEDYAHRFGLSNSDCVKDPRIGRLVRYKMQLDDQVRAATAINIRPLARAVGFTVEEADHLDSRIVSICKGIRDSQRFLAILSPKKRNATPTQEKK